MTVLSDSLKAYVDLTRLHFFFVWPLLFCSGLFLSFPRYGGFSWALVGKAATYKAADDSELPSHELHLAALSASAPRLALGRVFRVAAAPDEGEGPSSVLAGAGLRRLEWADVTRAPDGKVNTGTASGSTYVVGMKLRYWAGERQGWVDSWNSRARGGRPSRRCR